ncbi:site-specific DNA-methyltransferase [Ferrigenium sp. UT5]|uniref:site-specific DNA-methyltransferase n=1 Tax=Ferrigenium sp. UT5 TaxID=3242105 RepID=UPI0035543DD7
MSSLRKQKLELTWIGKENRPKLEPRILLEDPAKSYHAKHRVTENDLFDNRLIFGDNLLALKALEAEFVGKVKCVFIDPPYNTGSAFEHYDDALEHSTWLGLMRDRLEVIRRLLSPTGFICCHIDDSEGHYLKVLMDEVFGRSNYLVTMYVQVRYAEKTLKQDMAFHKQIEQIHVYRKDYGAQPNQNSKDLSFDKFCYYITEKGVGKTITLGGKTVQVFQSGEWKVERKEGSATGLKEIWATGSILDGNSSGRFFRDYLTGRASEDGLGVLYKVNGIGDDGLGYRYLTGPARATATKGKYYQGVPLAKLEPDAEAQTSPIENFYDLAGSFGNCRHEGGADFRSGKKPEALLEIVLKHFSSPGDLVLDSFAGSGTTGAVAHKMGRRWIMVELGEHCHTHIIPRLQKVIDGEDTGGISEAVNWQGGGGFRYYSLAPSLLQQDSYGQWVINKEYNAEMLAQALCKLEGFTYAPSDEHYWMHGNSTESDFIYVTTQTLNADQLQALSDEVGEGRSLLVCCGAFRGAAERFPNLTLKKIPKMVLQKCEWGHDDYSLKVENLPQAVPHSSPLPVEEGVEKSKSDKNANPAQAGLFAGDEQ